MDEKQTRNEEIEIDLSRLVGALLKKAWLIGAVAVVCAVLTLVYTVVFVAPKYQSGAMFYVNNTGLDVGIDSIISASDISASKDLVNSYIVILKTRETLNDVIDYAGVDRSYGEVRAMISAESVDETEIFRVTVTCEDPEEAEKIADAIAYILPKRIASIIDGTSAKVVESAVLPSGASSPSYTKNTLLGFALGLVLMAGIVVVLELMDITIRTEEDITQNCKHPILASVPDMSAPGKGSSQYGYARGARKDTAANTQERPTALYGDRIGFAAAESYKLLRTKLQFSFTEGNGCRVIGVTSAMVNEGKSLTSINLAYSLAELGKRVILLDGDMRKPTLAEKLGLNKKPGLSSCLTGQSDLSHLIQSCTVSGEDNAFHVITAGQNPPNPVELLSSAKMDATLETLRKHYDYIIVDLPPIKEVSDALAIADKMDGMLLVVRQNHCNRVDLGAAIRQLAFVNAKVLGVVFNGVGDSGKGYGKKYYNRYYRHYGYYYRRNGKQETKK